MLDLIQIVGVTILALVAIAGLRLIGDLSVNGVRKVREVREEGGGIVQKARGELSGGQRKPSTARAHGLHMKVRDGRIVYRRKSVIAKEVV